LPAPAVVSTHIVDVEEECSLKCLEELYCFGFNFNSGITDKYINKENCQISGRSSENMEVMNGDDWIFYEVLSTVSKKLSSYTV
jgi:hypothetical protein